MLGLKSQFGVFPRQKSNIAESVGNLLHSRLLTEDRLRQYLQSPEMSERVREFIKDGLADILRPRKPHPSLRRILQTEFGLTHEVYIQREHLLANALKVIAAWLEEPERRADIENFVVRALDGLRGRTLEEVLGRDGLAHVSQAGYRIIAESLRRADEYLEFFWRHIPKDRTLREWLGPKALQGLYQAMDDIGPVILRHAANMLNDPEVFQAIVNALRHMIRQFIERQKREGLWARFKLWLADKFVGIEDKLRHLDLYLERHIDTVRHEI